MPTSVAIVDRDGDLVASIRGELERPRYRVLTVSTIAEALRLVKTYRIDVLVAELRVGGPGALALLMALTQRSPQTRVVMTTARATAEDYKRALELGAVELLTRPFTAEALVTAIRTAADWDQGFRGNLHGVGLLDVLQILHLGRRTVSVHLGLGMAIHMRDGEIIHAEHSSKTGKRALVALLAMNSGSVKTTALRRHAQTISESFERLLLSVLCAIDEGQPVGEQDGRPGESGGAPPPDDVAGVEDPIGERSAPRRTQSVAVLPRLTRSVRGGMSPPPPTQTEPWVRRHVRRRHVAGTGLVLLSVLATLGIGYAVVIEHAAVRVLPGAHGSPAVAPVAQTMQERSTDDTWSAAPSMSPRTSAPETQAESEVRRVIIKTRPPALELIHAGTGAQLGRSPVMLKVTRADVPLGVKARLGERVLETVLVADSFPVDDLIRVTADFTNQVVSITRNRPRSRNADTRRTARRTRRRTGRPSPASTSAAGEAPRPSAVSSTATEKRGPETSRAEARPRRADIEIVDDLPTVDTVD